MLLRIVSKYALATHIALAAALPAALTPFIPDGMVAQVGFWLAALTFIWMLYEPSVLAGESLRMARERVVYQLLHDVMFWFFLVVALFAFARYLNDGVELFYDAEKSQWLVKDPFITFLPASMPGRGLTPFSMVLAAGVAVLGIRNCIGAASRQWVALVATFLMGLSGIAAVICVCCGVDAFCAQAKAAFDADFHWGTLYAIWLPMAVAAGVQGEASRWGGSRLSMAVAIGGTMAGTVCFSPTISALAYLAIGGLFTIVALAYLKVNVSASALARSCAMIVFGLFIAVLLYTIPANEEISAAKKAMIDPTVAFTELCKDTRDILGRISGALWLQHPWCGAGEGAFGLNVPFLAEKADWTILPPEPTTAINGYWTLLSERGIVGCVVIATGLGILLVTWLVRLAGGISRLRAESQKDSALPLMAIPPVAWSMIPMVLAVGADLYFASVFSMSAFVPAAAAILALSAATFPKPKKKKKES